MSYLDPGLWPEIHVYEGEVVDGSYNGKGKATFTAGFKYEVRVAQEER